MFTALILLLLLPANMIDTGSYYIIFEQQMSREEIEGMNREIERFSTRLEKFFGDKKKVKTDIYVKSALPPDRFPEWGVGFFSSDRNAIYLKMHAYHNRDEFYRVLRHEMVHATLYGLFGRKRFRPLWLEEGLCDFLSGKRIGFAESQKLSFALMIKKIIPQDSLLILPWRKNRFNIELFYVQSLFIVQLLDEKGFLKDFVNWAYRRNAVSGPPHFRDWIDFEIWWQTELEERYKWFVLLNFEMLLAILIVIVFLMAYISKILQKRKQMQILSEKEENLPE